MSVFAPPNFKPAGIKPANNEPASFEPDSIDPASSEQASIDPANIKPASIDPASRRSADGDQPTSARPTAAFAPPVHRPAADEHKSPPQRPVAFAPPSPPPPAGDDALGDRTLAPPIGQPLIPATPWPDEQSESRPPNRRRRRTSRRLAVAEVMIAIVVGAVAMWAINRDNRPTVPFDITGLEPTLRVELAQPVALGRAALLNVSGLDLSDQPRTRVSVIHTTGVSAYRTEHWVSVTDGTAQISIATGPMQEAGQHSLAVFTDRQRGLLDYWVEPGPPEPGFVPVIGPTRITADSADLVVVTVDALDSFGNGLDDGTAVDLVVQRPDGEVDRYSGTIAQLLAGIELPSSPAVGTAVVVATIDGIPSEPVEFEQVPGPPFSLTLAADQRTVPADGRSELTVRATGITDRNGNPVVDGTAIEVLVESASGNGRLDAVVVNGEAVFLLPAPTIPGPITLTLRPDEPGAEAHSIGLTATRAVDDFTATWDADERAAKVGPVIAPNGGFVADGAGVELIVDDEVVVTGQVLDGHASLMAPPSTAISDASVIEVRILGITRQVSR